MQEIYQQTILKTVSFEGIGLHSGKVSKVKLKPGEDNQGIIFKRIDKKENNIIEANFNNVTSAKLCTTLENSTGLKVSTIEHLLAALYISGVDNLVIEIDNEEVPIMDGSSKEFIKLIEMAGTKKLESYRKFLKITQKVELENNDKTISIEPSNLDFQVNFKLNYRNKIIGNQSNEINFSFDNLEDIYSSRTFCMFEDIEKIKKEGLAKGGSLDNAIVVNGEKIENKGGLRNKKEFVNHKILDLAGDFLLSGYRVLGKVNCYQGGHQLSNSFLKKLFNSKNSFVEIKFSDLKLFKKTEANNSEKLAVNA